MEWKNMLLTWGPLIVIFGAWLFVMKRIGMGKGFRRHLDHYDRVEALLERIATAVERLPR